MHQISPEALSARENYKLLIGSVIPRPVALVVTQSEAGVVNIAPFSFFNIVSSEPALVSLSIQRKEGVEKDTARNLRRKKEAVIHILDEENVLAANQTAANLPPDVSEQTVAALTLDESIKVQVPSLNEAKIRFEVQVYQHVPIKKDNQITADFFILAIQHYVIDEQVYEDGKINPHSLKPVSRLAGNDYSKLGELFTLARPT